MRTLNWKLLIGSVALLGTLWLIGYASAETGDEPVREAAEKPFSILPTYQDARKALTVPAAPKAKEVPPRAEAQPAELPAFYTCECVALQWAREFRLGRVAGSDRADAESRCWDRARRRVRGHRHTSIALRQCRWLP